MHIRCRRNPLTEQLPSDSPGIVDMFTGRYQAMHVPSRDRCVATVLHFTISCCTDAKLPKLNTDQLRWVVGLFTGHCHLKGHLFKLELTDDPNCERCLEEDESATHILCDCEAIAYLRFRHLGQFFMEPSDYYDPPPSHIYKVLHFIRGVGLIKE
jgi:hypothetical protein